MNTYYITTKVADERTVRVEAETYAQAEAAAQDVATTLIREGLDYDWVEATEVEAKDAVDEYVTAVPGPDPASYYGFRYSTDPVDPEETE